MGNRFVSPGSADDNLPPANYFQPEGDPDKERIQLQKVTESGTFARSPRLTRLLSYLCAKCFAGQEDQLKEYTIAVELFGRSEDFQSKDDASIRVDVNRLRRQLKKYYRSEGKNDELIISIPSGQYVPRFSPNSSAPAEAQAGDPGPGLPAARIKAPRPRSTGARRIVHLVLLAAGLCLGVVVTLVIQSNPSNVRSLADSVPFQPAFSAASEPSVPGGPEVRLIAGAPAEQYIDKYGVVWSGDKFFKGGLAVSYAGLDEYLPADNGLWRTAREGDFAYDIPLKPGAYQLHLYFIEMLYGTEFEGGGEASREFCVFANGKHILTMFDIFSDAGASRTPDIKVFKDVTPAEDGFLHLRFESKKSKAVLSAIEILPGLKGKMRPIRLVCRNTSYTTRDGTLWSADRFVRGGRLIVRPAQVAATNDPGLFSMQRYGHFHYTIPVAPGRYTLRLLFADGPLTASDPGFWQRGPRLFSVFCNGETLLRDFSIEKEAGGENRATVKTFTGLESNAQGKLIADFVPVRNYACLNALEVVAE